LKKEGKTDLNNDLLYKIGLSLIPNVGPILTRRLLTTIGSPEGVFNEKPARLRKIPGFGDFLIKQIDTPTIMEKAEQEIAFIEKYKINYLFYTDKNYPLRLKQCEDAPVIFYFKGDVDWNSNKIISIVGTRSATSYGKELCLKLVKGCIERGHQPVIVSGLAYGIDITAHREALKNGLLTVAVLGHGLHTIYPAVHTSFAKDISHQGALLTEFSSQTKPDRNNFVRRNRLIAGLSDATIVVESGIKGGALITADIANSYNRDVLAFPGREGDPFSRGCNFLIKTNRAGLIESARDLEYALQWDTLKKEPKQKTLFAETTKEEDFILELLRTENELSVDFICLKSNFPVNKVSGLLLNLEFKGLIKSLPGKMYRAIS
jgi:DNA processing protein